MTNVLYLTEMLLSENVVEAWPSFTFTDPNFSLTEGHTRQCQEEKLEMWFKELHTQCQLVILNVVIFLETKNRMKVTHTVILGHHIKIITA